MSLIKKLAGETVIYGIGQILPRILHYIVFSTYLTYRLNDSQTEYAIYVDLYAYVSVLIVIFSLRMDTAFFRYASRAEDFEKVYATAFLPIVLLSVSLLLVGHGYAYSIASWLGYADKSYYVKIFSWIVALDVMLLLPFARMRMQSQAKTFVGYKIFNIAITIVLVLLFLEGLYRLKPDWLSIFGFSPYTDDVSYVFLANLLASAILFILFLIRYRPACFIHDKVLLKTMVQYAWPLVIVGVAGSVNQFFGVPLQKWFLGGDFEDNMRQAALYGAAQKIPALLAIFTTAYNYAAEPFFFKNSREKDSRKLYGDVTLFFIIAAGMIAVGLQYGLDLAQYLIGGNFREGLFVVPILLMAYLMLGVYYNVSIWYKLSDKTLFGALIAVIGMVITLAGSIVLLPMLGYIASAWVALLCYGIMVILAVLLGAKYYPIIYPLRAILGQIGLISILLLLAPYILIYTPVVNIVIGAIVILCYAGMSFVLHQKRIKEYGLF